MIDTLIFIALGVLALFVAILWQAVKQLSADRQRIDNYLHEVSNRVFELEYADEEAAKKTTKRRMQ